MTRKACFARKGLENVGLRIAAFASHFSLLSKVAVRYFTENGNDDSARYLRGGKPDNFFPSGCLAALSGLQGPPCLTRKALHTPLLSTNTFSSHLS